MCILVLVIWVCILPIFDIGHGCFTWRHGDGIGINVQLNGNLWYQFTDQRVQYRFTRLREHGRSGIPSSFIINTKFTLFYQTIKVITNIYNCQRYCKCYLGSFVEYYNIINNSSIILLCVIMLSK